MFIPGLDIRRRAATEELFLPARPEMIVADKVELYAYAAKIIGEDAPVSVLEFGVAGGFSLTKLLASFRSPLASFTGFDSFEGIPEAWAGFERGAFSSNGALPAINDPRLRFVSGWFQNTVPGWLANPLPVQKILVHFDADIYGSTLFLLTTLWHHINEYYFLMDDLVHDDLVALYDFQRAYPVELEFLAQVGKSDGIPPTNQIFGRLKRIPFSL